MSNANLNFPRDLLTRFILLYKEYPCLWNRKSVSYKHKEKRLEAISRLTELIHEYDPNATRVHVLRKIESLRACVRREYKKVRASLREAKSPEEIYEPSLWYYDLLSFALIEPGVESIMKREVMPKNESSEDYSDLTDDSYDQSTEDNNDYSAAGSIVENVVSSSIEKHDEDTTEEDDCDALGIYVSGKLKALPSNMKVLAKKLIMEILFQAQTHSLTPSTVLSTPDPIK